MAATEWPSHATQKAAACSLSTDSLATFRALRIPARRGCRRNGSTPQAPAIGLIPPPRPGALTARSPPAPPRTRHSCLAQYRRRPPLAGAGAEGGDFGRIRSVIQCQLAGERIGTRFSGQVVGCAPLTGRREPGTRLTSEVVKKRNLFLLSAGSADDT
ncbi:hypothetical protein GQ53DRAFT_754441 [Thozetella sp. PMI_491]|nr:hypothetical protein GQ53DRAFT_754441 [Thozetella sp. PMI_491]